MTVHLPIPIPFHNEKCLGSTCVRVRCVTRVGNSTAVLYRFHDHRVQSHGGYDLIPGESVRQEKKSTLELVYASMLGV